MGFEELVLAFFDGVGNTNFDIVIMIIQFLYISFWIVVMGWVWADASERSTNKGARLGSVALVGILNIIGLIIYLLIRPKQTIQEIYWADLERRYLKYETSELKDCPSCKFSLAPGYNVCPRCGFDIKKQCPSCQVWIDRSFRYCPYCKNSFEQTRTVEVAAASPEKMQEEVAKTTQEAINAVENKQTKYVVKSSLLSKVKGEILTFVKKVGDSVVNRRKRNRIAKAQKEETNKIESRVEIKKDKKKNKKRKHKR